MTQTLTILIKWWWHQSSDDRNLNILTENTLYFDQPDRKVVMNKSILKQASTDRIGGFVLLISGSIFIALVLPQLVVVDS